MADVIKCPGFELTRAHGQQRLRPRWAHDGDWTTRCGDSCGADAASAWTAALDTSAEHRRGGANTAVAKERGAAAVGKWRKRFSFSTSVPRASGLMLSGRFPTNGAPQ